MIELFAYFLIGVAIYFGWLAWTKNITFPLLFDSGLMVSSLGYVVVADALLTDHNSGGYGLLMIGLGITLMSVSLLLKKKAINGVFKTSPRRIDDDQLHHPVGGRE